MIISEFIEKYEQKTGNFVLPGNAENEYTALCPAHDDGNPSLSISAQNGKILVCCHAGCSTPEIVAALGLKMADLFHRKKNTTDQKTELLAQRMRAKAHKNHETKETTMPPKEKTTYDTLRSALDATFPVPDHRWRYKDAAGKVIGAIFRWDATGDTSKKILPLAKQADGRWAYAGMAAPRPMMNLPDLLASPDRTVWIVEGEKCADALTGLGLLATTSAGGAQGAKKTDWTPLAGRKVYLYPDNDDAGRTYIQTITKTLLALDPPATVSVIAPPPEAQEGDDVADWLAQRPKNEDKKETRKALRAMAQPLDGEDADDLEQAAPERALQYVPMPLDVFPDPVRRYIRAVAKALPCAHEAIALPLLSVLAAAIGNSRRIEIKKSWSEPCVIWTATVLRSGQLKSPSHEKALIFLRDRQMQMMKTYDMELLTYHMQMEQWEAAQKAKKKNKSHEAADDTPKPVPPAQPRLTINDATLEAIAPILAENPRGLLLERDELSGWIGSFDRYTKGGGGDLATYLSMHRADSIIIDRKTGIRRTHVPRAALSICGTIQPGALKRCLTREYFERGLPARILLAMPVSPPRRWTDRVIPDGVHDLMDGLIEALLSLRMEEIPLENPKNKPQTDAEKTENDEADEAIQELFQTPIDYRPVLIPLSPEARELHRPFYNSHAEEQENLEDEDTSAAFSKLEGYAARFALIFALCRDPETKTIDARSMADAIRLTAWFKYETRRIYLMFKEDEEKETDDEGNPIPSKPKHLAELAHLIRTRFGGRVTSRDLQHVSRKYRPAAKAEAALEALVLEKYGKWDTHTAATARKPKTEFVLFDNPILPEAPTLSPEV